jgi:hypothetical protein
VQLLEGFHCVKLDVQDNSLVQSEYDVQTVPTIILQNSLGMEAERIEGYTGARELYEVLIGRDWSPVEFPAHIYLILPAGAVLGSIFALFLTLVFAHRLPYDSGLKSFGHAAGVAGALALVQAVVGMFINASCCVSLFVEIPILRSVYELSYTEIFIYYALKIFFTLLVLAACLFLVGASLFEQLASQGVPIGT